MTDEVEMKWIASNASLLNLVLQSRWVQNFGMALLFIVLLWMVVTPFQDLASLVYHLTG